MKYGTGAVKDDDDEAGNPRARLFLIEDDYFVEDTYVHMYIMLTLYRIQCMYVHTYTLPYCA